MIRTRIRMSSNRAMGIRRCSFCWTKTMLARRFKCSNSVRLLTHIDDVRTQHRREIACAVLGYGGRPEVDLLQRGELFEFC